MLSVGSEVCTRNKGQTNNCWNTAHDTLADISRSVLNDTYLSLSSSRPSLSSWTFSPASLLAATQISSSSTTSSTPSSSSTTPPAVSATVTDSPTPTPSSDSGSSGISGGAIGGIVVGVVAVLALVAGFGFYYSRRRNRQKRVEMPAEPAPPVYKDDGAVKVELSSQPRPQELSADPQVAELEAGR